MLGCGWLACWNGPVLIMFMGILASPSFMVGADSLVHIDHELIEALGDFFFGSLGVENINDLAKVLLKILELLVAGISNLDKNIGQFVSSLAMASI